MARDVECGAEPHPFVAGSRTRNVKQGRPTFAPREILALTPGYADMDFTRLPYRDVTRPIFPLDPEVRWHPIITNVAGYDEEIG